MPFLSKFRMNLHGRSYPFWRITNTREVTIDSKTELVKNIQVIDTIPLIEFENRELVCVPIEVMYRITTDIRQRESLDPQLIGPASGDSKQVTYKQVETLSTEIMNSALSDSNQEVISQAQAYEILACEISDQVEFPFEILLRCCISMIVTQFSLILGIILCCILLNHRS